MSTEENIEARIAAALRQLREQRGLTLRRLAARSGVSASMISAIERAAKSPTVATLDALAAALGVPLADLLAGAPAAAARIRIVRTAEQRRTTDPASGARRADFGPPIAGSGVAFLRYTIPPRGVAGPFAAHEPGTIEHVHLAAGSLRLTLGDESVSLEAGDSCSCRADAPHDFDNRASDVEALLYLVVEAPARAQPALRRRRTRPISQPSTGSRA